MTVCMVAQVEVLDPTQWQRYKEIAAPAIARHGLFFVPGLDEADTPD